MAENYDASSIVKLDGLEAVRKRPGMYIGSTDVRGLHHLIWEIVDNSIDEALAGHGEEIKIIINKDNSITVEDQGRGIPVDKHKSGVSAAEVIFTELHAGGKFNEGAYKTSGGLHGVGASVTNALSEWLKVTVYKGGSRYTLSFKDGGHLDQPLKKEGSTSRKGTTVSFKPDEKIFSSTDFNYTTIATRLKEKAYLMQGLAMTLVDKRIGKEETFLYPDGLVSYLKELNQHDRVLHKAVLFNGTAETIELDFAFQYTDGESERVLSFVNNVRTSDGGTHETGFKNAFTKTFNEFVKKYKLNKKTFDGSDIREGITAIISIKVPEKLLEFEGQTKTKLGTPKARNAVEQTLSTNLESYLEQNRDIATKLISKMVDAQRAREAAKKARSEAKKTKKKLSSEKILSGKLTPAQSKKYHLNELYLVEGDSAGGSAKQGRDRKHQAILPLRGKVVNTEKLRLTEAVKNEEIATMINTIGAGVGKEFDITNAKYGKVIIMTDADTDGAHIQVLLLTFFYRFMRGLIEEGHVYIALPPLYKISKGTGKSAKISYAWTDEDLNTLREEYKSGYIIQRYKGLGEMNADQLWDTTMDPETRSLIKVTIEDAILAEQRVSILMGSKPELRREWIEENVKFTLEDTFKK